MSNVEIINIPGDKRQPGISGAWSIVVNLSEADRIENLGGGGRQKCLAVVQKHLGPSALNAALRQHGGQHLIRN